MTIKLSDLEGGRLFHNSVVIIGKGADRLNEISSLLEYHEISCTIIEGLFIDKIIIEKSKYDIFILCRYEASIDAILDVAKIAKLPGAPGVIVLGESPSYLDRIIALELGADSYLDSSSSPLEVVAQVRALVRRKSSDKTILRKVSSISHGLPVKYHFGGWVFNAASLRLISPSGVYLVLTNFEVKIISAFVSSPGHVYSRDELVFACNGVNDSDLNRSMDVSISRLRLKLSKLDAGPVIKTVRGKGYVLHSDVTVFDT